MKSPHQNVGLWFPEGAGERKQIPVMTGVLDYFPLAIAEIARLSRQGNLQHKLEGPLHWARGKSNDHADCLVRHLMERGVKDADGFSHTTKAAWRALALLQEELEREMGFEPAAEADPSRLVFRDFVEAVGGEMTSPTTARLRVQGADLLVGAEEYEARHTPDEENYYSQPPEKIWPLGPTGEGQE